MPWGAVRAETRSVECRASSGRDMAATDPSDRWNTRTDDAAPCRLLDAHRRPRRQRAAGACARGRDGLRRCAGCRAPPAGTVALGRAARVARQRPRLRGLRRRCSMRRLRSPSAAAGRRRWPRAACANAVRARCRSSIRACRLPSGIWSSRPNTMRWRGDNVVTLRRQPASGRRSVARAGAQRLFDPRGTPVAAHRVVARWAERSQRVRHGGADERSATPGRAHSRRRRQPARDDVATHAAGLGAGHAFAVRRHSGFALVRAFDVERRRQRESVSRPARVGGPHRVHAAIR